MTSASETTGVRVCLFELAGQHFGLRLESVSEIAPMASLARPPSMPSILEGFLNLRGTSVPVLKLAVLLGLPQDRLGLHTPLVIVRGRTAPIALLVNAVHAIVVVPAAALSSIPESDTFNGCVESALTADGSAVHLLSLEGLLLEKERQTLAEAQATETRRLRQAHQSQS